jgi:hypothetical protein
MQHWLGGAGGSERGTRCAAARRVLMYASERSGSACEVSGSACEVSGSACELSGSACELSGSARERTVILWSGAWGHWHRPLRLAAVYLARGVVLTGIRH